MEILRDLFNTIRITNRTTTVMTLLAEMGVYTTEWDKIEKIVKENPEKTSLEIIEYIKEESAKHAQQ